MEETQINNIKLMTEQQLPEMRPELAPSTVTDKTDPITLFWENLTFHVPLKAKSNEPHNYGVVERNGKPMRTVVESLTGVARPNEIIGLLGPSSGGKTVLMNIFSSRLVPPRDAEYKREVYVNNKIPLDRALFGKIGAYVMQDDVLLETLTPYECLKFAATLRLCCSNEEIEERVKKIIEDLRLGTCKHTLVGNVLKKGISGGERKRTSIGVEIVTDPSLIILDELTSGLDSYTAYTIVKVLKELSRRGRTIMAVVHQPSTDIFELFDRIYLLAGGREVYQGETTKIYDYFKMIGREIPPYTNPADQLIKLMHAKEKPDDEDLRRQEELFTSYTKHLRQPIIDSMPELASSALPFNKEKFSAFRASSFGLQFQQLLTRAFKNLIRNSTFTTVRIVQTVVLAILLILLYWRKVHVERYDDYRDMNNALFFIANTQFMLSLQSVLLTFPLERGLFLREQANRMYGVFPYYLTKTCVEVPYQLCMPILFTLIVYWAIGIRNTAAAFFTFLAALLVIVFLGNSLGVMLSSLFSNVRTAFAIVPVIIMPLMLFCGFMSNVETIVIWLRWLQYLSPIRYTLEIFFRLQYKKGDFENPMEPLVIYPPDSYNYNLGTAWCFGIMLMIAVAARGFAYVFLKLQTLNV